MRRILGWLLVLAVGTAACSSTEGPPSNAAGAPTPSDTYEFPPPPDAPTGPLSQQVRAALDDIVAMFAVGLERDALRVVAASGDARLGWIVSDLLRFIQSGDDQDELVEAFVKLTGVDPSNDPKFDISPWLSVTDHMIAWDLAAPPGYRSVKGDLFTQLESAWAPFFSDRDSDIDWRWVSWGGVFIDGRAFGDREPCPQGCIPALDVPPLTGASEGDWYPDERLVFGVVVGDEAVAFPKNIMEVHELVNMTIGGRRVGIPYCTLCGSAQAYLTDSVPESFNPPVLRTSGLLSRSNKVMYDLHTKSVFDTFTGKALSGPLQDAGVSLEQVTVVTSTWGEWKEEHPDTKIVAEGGGRGERYPLDPLGGRDDDGPIFPIGPADPRLPVQMQVVGVIAADGTPVAFPADQARAALEAGDEVAEAGVTLRADAGGLRAFADGEQLPAHQAFWFAWSQFHPETIVWTPLDS